MFHNWTSSLFLGVPVPRVTKQQLLCNSETSISKKNWREVICWILNKTTNFSCWTVVLLNMIQFPMKLNKKGKYRKLMFTGLFCRSSPVRVGLVRTYVVGLENYLYFWTRRQAQGVEPNGTSGPSDSSQTLHHGNHPRMGNTSGEFEEFYFTTAERKFWKIADVLFRISSMTNYFISIIPLMGCIGCTVPAV